MASAVENIDEIATVPKEEWPYELPEGWKWVRGRSIFEPMETKLPTGNQFRYIDIDSINNDKQTVETPKCLFVKDAPSRASRGLKNGDTVFSLVRPYLRNIAYIDASLADCIASTGFYVCRPNYLVDGKYLYWLMTSDYVVDGLMHFMKGDNSPSIKKNDIEHYLFPIAPKGEQPKLVKKIETFFAKLDNAKDLVRNALDSSETRKAAILHKAFTGELTVKWREEHNISIDSWQNKRFDAFCLLKRGFDLPANRRISGEYPLVSSSGIIDSHNEPAVNGPGVVTGRSGSIGKVFYIDRDYWPLNTTLYSKDLFGNDAKYTYYYLQTFDFNYYSSSTSVPTLNRNLFASEMIDVPSLPEQHEIVRILDEYFNQDKTAIEVMNIINKIMTIKKVLLNMFFHGVF